MTRALRDLATAFFVALAATVAHAAPGLVPGSTNDFEVELPADLRAMIHGRSAVAHARVTIVVPADVDPAVVPPVLLVSATADAGYNSSRALLRRYADVATANGWLVVAADSAETVSAEDDDVPLRIVLDLAALALLAQQWPGAERAGLAFAGFSGGAKFAGWLAAAFARQGRSIVGVYQAGINEDALLPAAARFDTMNAVFRGVPVFLQSGRSDEIATPVQHREVATKLKRAGFEHVRVEYVDGPHRVDPAPLATALHWFRELSTPQT